jgi:hypothetical protein
MGRTTSGAPRRARNFHGEVSVVTANIVDLLIVNRFPVSRLVDWIDQAVLLLQLDDKTRVQLRRVGVRTVTDLLSVDSKGLPVDRLLIDVVRRKPALDVVWAWRFPSD